MAKIDENLSNIFDVSPIGEKANEIVEVKDVSSSTDKISDDYDNTRDNLYELLNKGKDALEHALVVAQNSEHPRAFEVVGNLMKQLSDINHQLVDLHAKRADLENKSLKENDSGTKNITNNAIFVGSTSELSKMIENMKKGD